MFTTYVREDEWQEKEKEDGMVTLKATAKERLKALGLDQVGGAGGGYLSSHMRAL